MKRIKIIFAAIVCAAALISCSKEMDQKRENTGGEIKTLSFGIDQSTKSTLTLGADGAMKMGWNTGDRILVAKGEKVYVYKLSSTGIDGKGVFTAEGKGVPDLTGNTEKVSIYHLGTDLYVDYVKTTNNLSDLSVGIGGGTQTGNGTFAHLAKDCILERVLETAPTTVEELEGTLKPKTSILTFNIPAPTTLAEGEIPTSAILTVCSYNTSFAGSLKATDQGVTIEQSVKKLEVKLKETGNWNASTPLKVSFNVLMDNNSHTAGSDAWIVEVQTNKRKLYTSEKLTIKNKPAVGAYYNASITSVKEETSLPCYATFEDDINAIKKEIHAVFQDSYSCAYNYSFLNQVYASILIEDESGNPVFDYYVESGKGGEGGKGAFLGDGFVNAILYPGKTYTITPYIVIEQNIVYFGTAKSYTPTGSISFASGDLGLSVIWADKNVGAAKTEDVGRYYAWGVKEPYSAPFTYEWFNGSKVKKYVSQDSHSESGTADGLTVLVAADDVASAESEGEWRMPTKEEIDELKALDCLEGYELNGKKGLLFVGNGTHMKDGLFIPYGGYKDKSDTPVSTNYAYLWSSSLVTASSSAPEYIDYGAYTLQNIVEGHEGWKTTDIAALRSSARNVRGVKARK